MSDKDYNWQVTVLTLFPEIFPGPLQYSLAGKALAKKIWQLNVRDIRSFATTKHKIVDDKPFGGGTGMVLKPDVIDQAISQLNEESNIDQIIYLSPRGELFNQRLAEELISLPHVLFLAGRYEGVDQRVIDKHKMREMSIGDYILSGGEIATLAIIDSCIRLLPKVIGKETALEEESFSSTSNYQNLLEYPHYTRPEIWEDIKVPDILLSGHHANIAKWRLAEAEKITKTRRPDLWKRHLKTKITK